MKKIFLGTLVLVSVLAIVTITSGQIPESNKIRIFLGLSPVSAENPFPVTASDGSGPLTVDGSINIGTFPDNEPFNLVQIAGGSISLGAKTGALSFPVVFPTDLFGQKVMTSSIPMTIASDQSAVPISGTVTANAGTGTFVVGDGGLSISIDDNASSITVDGDLGLSSNDADLDSDAGTDNHEVVTIGLPGSGGHVIGGTATNPLRVDTTGSTTQPVSGTVTANAGTGTFVVGDGVGNLTVDGTVTANAGTGTFIVGDGVGNLTVDGTVTANAGTGTFIVGDGAGNLTVDGTVTSTPIGSVRAAYTATFSVIAQIGTFLEINGPSSGKTEIIEIFVAKPTSAAQISMNARSTLTTGGTPATRTATPHDSADSAATSVVRQFTADPTEGTLVGEVRAPVQVGTTETMTWTWGESIAKPLVLRPGTEVLTIETNAAATIKGHIMWTEG